MEARARLTSPPVNPRAGAAHFWTQTFHFPSEESDSRGIIRGGRSLTSPPGYEQASEISGEITGHFFICFQNYWLKLELLTEKKKV